MTLSRRALYGAFLVCALSATRFSWGQASDLPVIVNTGPALEVNCDTNLNFGAILIAGDSEGGAVQLLAEASAVATITGGSGLALAGASQPARCSVTAVSGTTVTLSLSGGGGVFDPATGVLSGALLSSSGNDTVSVDLSLSHIGGEPGTSEEAEPVYIGGTLSIPAGASAIYGVYEEVFTITVVED
ncbi:DUF4402 domain-containing protein [Marinimicrobium sp. C6131]|uniref:DUF4402 domain-containing protein n=1 Tax=Marinimicrobium sp. C6131 TaxID=3022676 RepID=UPI00223E57FE|nr:DUF4402 domain-containing protein [Marinimicrobium sp. C6131]UZJ45091.1 DUF4402 domain-containing protein [Marinimicrobium sp. C6131]